MGGAPTLEADHSPSLTLRRDALRRSILLVDGLQRRSPGWLPPLALPLRWLSNHYIPRAVRIGFKGGIVRVNGVLLDIPRPRERWGVGGEFHMAMGTYEVAELSYVRERLRPGDTFVDVGAHIGYYTVPLAKRVGPGGRVIALEPTPSSVKLLNRNLELNGIDWALVVEAAASSNDGPAALLIDHDTPMWNALTTGSSPNTRESIAVRQLTLDTLLAESGWPALAGIKIDAEGAEMAVLIGAQECLERNPGAFLVLELCGLDERRRGSAMDILRYLEARRYSFRRLDLKGPASLLSVASIAQHLRAPTWQQSVFNIVAERR